MVQHWNFVIFLLYQKIFLHLWNVFFYVLNVDVLLGFFSFFYTEDAQMSFDEDKQRRYTTTSSITLYPGVDDNGAIYSCEARHPALERYLRCSVAINVLRMYHYISFKNMLKIKLIDWWFIIFVDLSTV